MLQIGSHDINAMICKIFKHKLDVHFLVITIVRRTYVDTNLKKLIQIRITNIDFQYDICNIRLGVVGRVFSLGCLW